MSLYDQMYEDLYGTSSGGSTTTALESVQERRKQRALKSRSPRTPKQYLPPEQKSSLLAELASAGGGFISTIGKTIDTPGAIFRGVLAGQPTSGFTWNNRVSGEDLLKSYGVIDDKTNPYASTALGFAAEVATDPLSMFFGAARALNLGGKAAKYTNLLDKAGDVAFTKLGKDTASRIAAVSKTRTGSRALKRLDKASIPVTPKNIAQHPLVGKRVAQTQTTLRELAEGTSKTPAELQKRIKALDDYLKPRGSSYEQVKNQTLSGAFGIGYFTPMATFNPKAAQPFLDSMDALSQAVRWSYPTRLGSALFSTKVGGKTDVGGQIASMRRMSDLAEASSNAAGQSAKLMEMLRTVDIPKAAVKQLGGDNLLSPEAKNFVLRQVEGVGTAADEQIRKAIGPEKIDAYVDTWHSLNDANVKAAQDLGMKTKKYQGIYGDRFSPRYSVEADFGEYGRGQSLSEFSAQTAENQGRKIYMQTPGSTSDINEATKLPIVQKMIREGGVTKEQAATAIREYLNEKHSPLRNGLPNPTRRVQGTFQRMVPERDAAGNIVYEPRLNTKGQPIIDKATGKPKMKVKLKGGDDIIDQQQARKIAGAAARIDPTTKEGTGLFDMHPVAAQAKNLQSQAMARANAKGVFEMLAESAQPLKGRVPSQLPGQNKRLSLALRDIAEKAGLQTRGGKYSKRVADALKRELAAVTGEDFSKISLKDYAVDEATYNRLTAMQDFYNSPRAQQEIVGYLDAYTGLYKSHLLAFPSRHVRDMYSNAISVYLEVGDPIVAHRGFKIAKLVLDGKFDEAEKFLGEFARYKGAAGGIREQFVKDVAESGVLRTLATDDLTTANKSGALQQFLPGSVRQSYGTVLDEFVPGRGEFSGKASDFVTFRGVKMPGQTQRAYATKNPMLNASEKLSEYTDSVARLGGFIAMISKGANPEYAAKRITASLVDYSSLTAFERNVIRRYIFPWWAYNSRIGKYAVESLVNNPGGGYAQLIRGMRVLQESDDDTYIPEAMRQQFAMRVPDFLEPILGIDPNNETTTFFKDFDAPGLDVLSLVDPQATTIGTIQGTMQNLALQGNPIARSIIEYATDTDLFSRRPLTEAVTPLDRIYRRATGSATNLDPTIKTLANLTPFPRVAGIAGGLVDDRIPMDQRVIKQLFNTMTGVKMQTADPAWQLSDARRKAAEKLKGFMTDYTESYIPEERIPQVPPELLPYFQLYQSLGRDLRNARKSKKQ